jgi:NAD(P)-dependent dehydrogenase (short-subunit alcohol dehydrogenase family)
MAGAAAGGLERPVNQSAFVFFGGSTGIGHAAALQLGRRGAHVLIVGRGREAGEAAVAQVKAAGAGAADFLAVDISTVSGIVKAAEGVAAWRPVLHGLMHTAMVAVNSKQVTADGFELAFALQYLARAALNRLLVSRLAASGDGRIVHIAGDVPGFIKPDLDDLQFERTQWSFMKAVLGTHVLGFLHVQEAAARWQNQSVTISASCVGATKTKAMADPNMPWLMRAMGRFGVAPEISARNAVRLLTAADTHGLKGAVLRSPTRFAPEPIERSQVEAARLWELTTRLAADRGLDLP